MNRTILPALLLVAPLGGAAASTAGAPAPEAAGPAAGDAAVPQPDLDRPSFLDKLVVTATGDLVEDFRVAYTVDLVDGEELRFRRQVRTIPEALQEEPGVMVQKTSHGQGSPFLRGFTGFRTLLLVDGIRVNHSAFREGPNQYWTTVDPLSVERLELVKGPSSVLYGSDAVGGTVNLLTVMTPRTGQGPFGGRAHLRAASAEDSTAGRLQLHGGGEGRFHFLGGLSLKSYGDLEAGGEVGRQPRTGYDEQDGDLKFEVRLDDRSYLVATYQGVSVDDAWRTHRTIYGISWQGTTVGSELQRVLDQERQLGYLQYHWRGDRSWLTALHASLSYQQQEEERFRQTSPDRADLQGFDVDTLGAWLRLEKAAGDTLWTLGLEHYRDQVSSFRNDLDGAGRVTRVRIQGPVGDDAEYDLTGVYLQAEWQGSARFSMIGGARFTSARADARRVQDPLTGEPVRVTDDWEKLVGNLRFLYQLDRRARWQLFGGISQGFRAPNLSDLTRFDTARSSEIETPAFGLEPENFVAYELGVKTRHGKFSGELAAFRTQIAELIVRTPTGRILEANREVTKRNGGDGFVQGLEARGALELGRSWSLAGDLTLLDGEVDTYPTSEPVLRREPLDRLQPATAHAALRWEPPRGSWWAEATVTAVDRQDELSTRDRSDTDRIPPGGTPGYTLYGLRGGYASERAWRVALSLENLTDRAYRVHGSGLNAPGLNLGASVSLDF